MQYAVGHISIISINKDGNEDTETDLILEA